MSSDNLTKLNGKQYETMKEQRSMKSKTWFNCMMAFIIGGVICIIAQIFKDIISSPKLAELLGVKSEEDSSSLTVLFMVFLGVLLTALNVYDNIGKVAGASAPQCGKSKMYHQ